MKKLMVSAVVLLAMLGGSWAVADSAVARSNITTGVVDREPIDDLDYLPASEDRAYFFTEIRGMADQSITHRWIHGGTVAAEVDFRIGGPRWRVWSSKQMMAHEPGEWLVEVVDGEGNVLHQKRFQYAAAP